VGDLMADKNVKPLPIQVPALGISYQIDIAQGRSLVFQTHVDATMDRETIDALLDDVARAANRQKAEHDLDEFKRKLASFYLQLKQHTGGLIRQEEDFRANWTARGKRGEWQATGQEITALQNIKTNLETLKANIEACKQEIANLEAIMAGEPLPEPPTMDEEPLAQAAE
jgi:DNA repair exonuclease SbcCD ATPase subunit